MLRLKLKSFLRQHRLTEVDLADAIADVLVESSEGISDRYLRYITQNTDPLTPDNRQRKPSLVVLGFIMKGLRQLTGEDIDISDLIEYLTDGVGTPVAQESAAGTTSDQSNGVDAASSSPSSYDLALLANNLETDEVLDEVWELTVHSLERKGFPGLSAALAALPISNERQANGRDGTTRKRSARNTLPLILLALLLVSIGFIAYEQFFLKPRLYAQFAGIFSLRDRIRPTSSLPVPTLIGPEGEIDQLAPVLRVTTVPGALAYEFYVQNLVSDDGVYTGPVLTGAFPIPEHTLCPNTTYAWRARALGNDGWTSFSSPLQFNISARVLDASQQDLLRLTDIKVKPATPVMIAPLGNTNTTTPTLEVAYDPDALGYGFYVRDLQADKIIYSNSFATDNAVAIPPGALSDTGIYQWNTRSRNCHYWSDFTPTQIFTVNVYE